LCRRGFHRGKTLISFFTTIILLPVRLDAFIMSPPFYPEPRGPRVLPLGELVLWYGMFAPCGRFLGTTGCFARRAP
jgi:hypothetical protein